MKRCIQCGSRQLRDVTEEDSLQVSGRTFTRKVPARRCRNCGETYFPIGPLLDLEREVTAIVARQGPCNGETFKYLRKGLGMRAADLAKLLDLAPETLSRWETGQRPVDRPSWLALSVMVLEHLEGKTTTLDRLKALVVARRLPARVHLSPRHA